MTRTSVSGSAAAYATVKVNDVVFLNGAKNTTVRVKILANVDREVLSHRVLVHGQRAPQQSLRVLISASPGVVPDVSVCLCF